VVVPAFTVKVTLVFSHTVWLTGDTLTTGGSSMVNTEPALVTGMPQPPLTTTV
jgi:hypothetical protein